MKEFYWQGKDLKGQTLKGVIAASSPMEVVDLLKRKQIIVDTTSIREKKKFSLKNLFFNKVKKKDLVLFTRQFATLTQAGIPYTQALEILSKQTESKRLAAILNDIKTKIEGGQSLSAAFQEHLDVFDELYVSLLKAGEEGGFLDTVLLRLSVYLEKALKLSREIKVALIYPAILLLVAVIVVAVILIFVIPTFEEIFSEFGAALPLPTRIVIQISSFTRDFWWLISVFLGASGYLLFKFSRREEGKRFFHPLLLKVPGLGELIKKANLARFSRTLSTMISSGVPILKALDCSAKVVGNYVIQQIILDSITEVSQGKNLNEVLKKSLVIPPIFWSMIAVGEQTGALDAMLERLAAFFEEEVDAAVQSLKQLIEPVMILILGVIIGGLVIAMYLPIFRLGSVVG
jgi:type IV pilus assembly protein PilC